MTFPLFVLACVFLAAQLVLGLPATLCVLQLPGQRIEGSPTSGGACRYTVRYGQAERWEDAVAPQSQTGYDTTRFPPACPQTAVVGSLGGQTVLSNAPGQSEDCLYAVIYTPKNLTASGRLPILVWIHGGSYYAGAASAPGLDGSALATQGNMIVVMIQYRLGILGLLPPSASPSSSDPTLALKDVILAMKQVQAYAEYVGGDRGKVTIAGQSSGASLIRALLNAPQAKGLFRAAILQSDPMTYGTASSATTSRLRDDFYAQPGLSACKDLACLRNIPVAQILQGQERFIVAAPGLVEGVPVVTPLRPTHDTPSLTSEPTRQAFEAAYALSNPPAAISLLVTSTANEAGQVVQSLFPQPVPANGTTYLAILSLFVGPERAQILATSPEYGLTDNDRPDHFRRTLEKLLTDGAWRCAGRDFASSWAEQGGKVWVGEWTQGVSYLNNRGGGYCGQEGRVCHEDDIFPTFHSADGQDRHTTSLQDEVLARWTAFVHTLNPNPRRPAIPNTSGLGTTPVGLAVPLLPGGIGSERGPSRPIACDEERPRKVCKPKRQTSSAASTWARYTGEQGQVYAIGGGEVKACPSGFWGEKVKYDWQLHQ